MRPVVAIFAVIFIGCIANTPLRAQGASCPGPYKLVELTDCATLYCGMDAKDQAHKARLQAIDQTLDKLRRNTAQFQRSVEAYGRVCRVLRSQTTKKNVDEVMDLVRPALFELEARDDETFELVDSVEGARRYSEDASMLLSRFKDSKCSVNLRNQVKKRIEEAEAIKSQLNQINCNPTVN